MLTGKASIKCDNADPVPSIHTFGGMNEGPSTNCRLEDELLAEAQTTVK